MRNPLFLLALTLALLFILPGAGCSSNAIDSKPAVNVTYQADFNGETPNGNLNLVLDLTIKNEGYESFNTSPANFSVKVGAYSYLARESYLDTVELPNGDYIEGRLVFQVPPEAAVPRTGFTVMFSGKTPYNIQWVKAQSESETGSEPAGGLPVVNITYSTERYWLDAPGNQYLKVEPPGVLFLVAEMTIENKGYESFNIKPEYFLVEASSSARSVTAKVQGQLIDWRVLDIQNNGRYTGSLYFSIPEEVAQSFYRWEYKMVYSGVREYNIQWIKKNVVRLEVDAAETSLEPVYLANGSSIAGKLAFVLPPELASASPSYELRYHEKTSHNVQFFDSPDAANDVNRNPIAYPVIKVTYSSNVTRSAETDRIYLILNVLIENQGYESFRFFTLPANFFVEAKY